MDTKYNLVCVAHPDDETIFFGGLLLELKNRNSSRPNRGSHKTIVVCMTDANADGHGRKRKLQFQRACRALGVDRAEWWSFPDIYEKRLPVDQIESRLRDLKTSLSAPSAIYTHGIVGEYGHPHHQDVSYAVHRAFLNHPRLYSVAYNSFPEKRVLLTAKTFAEKSRILTRIYGSETTRFLSLLPSTFAEGFHRLEFAEVEAIYNFFVTSDGTKAKLNRGKLKQYAWLVDYLKLNRARPRPF